MELGEAIRYYREKSRDKGALLSTDECKQIALWLEDLKKEKDRGLMRIGVESYWGASQGVLDLHSNKVYVDTAIAEDIRAGVPIKLHF